MKQTARQLKHSQEYCQLSLHFLSAKKKTKACRTALAWWLGTEKDCTHCRENNNHNTMQDNQHAAHSFSSAGGNTSSLPGGDACTEDAVSTEPSISSSFNNDPANGVELLGPSLSGNERRFEGDVDAVPFP